jgi:hypothetical protein
MQMQAPHQHVTRGPVAVGASLLRLSIWQRLAIAFALTVALWAAVGWALLKAAS